jgi:hypothetical protein
MRNNKTYLYVWFWFGSMVLKKSFEDTKGAISNRIRRRTDNTMAKRKSTKGQTTIDFQQYFSYIVAVGFIGGRNWRKP